MAKPGRKKNKPPPVLLGGDEPAASPRSTRPPKRRINPYATCVVTFGHDGKIHMYLNAAIPDGHHPSEGICPKCGHAYSHMIGSGRHQCEECDGDDIALAAMRLEAAGINLGWGFSEHTRDYERERRNARFTARLQQDAKEV